MTDLNFSGFLAHCDAAFRQDIPFIKGAAKSLLLPPFSESHVFYMGDDREFQDSIDDVRGEINDEMRGGLPLPFKDISVASIVKKVDGHHGEVFSGEIPSFILDRLILLNPDHPLAVEAVAHNPGVHDRVRQWFLFARVHDRPRIGEVKVDPAFCFVCGFVGVTEVGRIESAYVRDLQIFGKNIASNFEMVAAISHPANYIVKVTPELSEKEARRVAAGKRYPAEKKRHFIVVDHDVLVQMRRDPQGTHASPVPHERRGHWRRLAERCRHAKLVGRDKVFVRPALIGDPEWRAGKNLYEVLPPVERASDLSEVR